MIAPTSIAAAQAIEPHAPSIRERVFDYIKSCGIHGATIDECANALGLRTATVCGRFGELQGKTYGENDQPAKRYPVRIVKSDERRMTTGKQSAQVWVAL